MSAPVDDLRQQAAEDAAEQAEQDAVIELVQVDHEAALEQLRQEPDDDQVVAWRQPR